MACHSAQPQNILPPTLGRVHFVAPLTCCFLPSLSLHILHQGLCLAMWSWLKRTLARRAVRSYAQAQLRQAEANVRSAEDTLAKAAGRPSEGAQLRACCEQMHAQLRNRPPSSAPARRPPRRCPGAAAADGAAPAPVPGHARVRRCERCRVRRQAAGRAPGGRSALPRCSMELILSVS